MFPQRCDPPEPSSAAPRLLARRRGAFTLIELLLALAILVAITALAAPSFSILLADQRLRASGEEIQSVFVKARVEAMRSGRTQMFRCQLQGMRYQVTPFQEASDILEAADLAGRGAMATDIATPALQLTNNIDPADTETLPDDCVFAQCQVQSTARSRQADTQAATSGDGWSQPVMFYPDGRSSFAIVTVSHPEMGAIDVKVRGITGRVELSQVKTQ